MQEVISRETAKEQGLKHYYTGKPCKYGHDSPRLVSTTRCTQCIKEYKQLNFERETAYSQKYREENPGYWRGGYEKKKAQNEALRLAKLAKKEELAPAKIAANKQKKKERDKEYREKNKERRRAWHKEYFSTGKGKMINKANGHKRRAMLRGNGGSFSEDEILYLEVFYNNACPVCDGWIGEEYNIDHVIPIVKGGDNFATNLQLLCEFCNKSKNDRLMEDWLSDELAYQRWVTQRFAMLFGLMNLENHINNK